MSKEAKKYLDAANDWETSRILEVERAARRANRDKYIAFGVVAVMALALALLAPLKQKVPYLIREDKVTGAVDVVGTLSGATLDSSEARDKYWVSRYVIDREGYDWYSLQKSYDSVRLLSSASIAQTYVKRFDGADALDKQYKNNVRIDVQIISIVLNNKQTATVRFRTKKTSSAGTDQMQSWIATVSFQYDSIDKLSESDRLLNPFGFQVLSYRVDPEMVSESAPQAATAAEGAPIALGATPVAPAGGAQ